ncbi:hypothetical protein QFW96_22300 [Saccharopolyspora sp. TS4A08]|uniref:Ricin B lectin domain-containing protein n=1 Tax=Saccharopolyspora ipomoeae TaxID=3042027 RepID=A0ABT6PTR4_9PSEU|nr:hypothetical protein [Saccharopolyspora sp. TS4A08]MDI2031377.1 hypothetical protein [Saccharopolyspora sp. TS4A08]
MRKNLVRAIPLLGALVLLGPAATVAQADPVQAMGEDGGAVTLDDNPGGKAIFFHDGDVLEVCDMQEDGLRAWGSVSWSDSSGNHRVQAEDTDGANPPDRCEFKNVNIPEGKSVTIEACLKDGADGARRYCFTGKGVA